MKKIRHNNYTSFLPIARRHWSTTVPFLSIRKTANIALAQLEKIFGKSELRSFPYFIKIEPTNKCNLKCAGCIHAADRADQSFKHGDIDMETFKKIVDKLDKYLVKVSLYYEGEPLLHPSIAEMAGYLSSKRIASVISTNFNYLPDSLAEELVKKKLTHLIISLDGYDRQSYESYRRGGDWEKVLANIKKLQAVKKRLGSKYPIVEAQAINFNDNDQDKLEKIRRVAEESGVDKFSVKEDLISLYKQAMPANKRCFWLYSSLSVKYDGTIQPCCFFYESPSNNFADISKYPDIKDIWNNEKFVSARKYFKNGEKKGDLQCYNCVFFNNK
jgi:radical SAM protein with 4Fe4S-binding SPASM domain